MESTNTLLTRQFIPQPFASKTGAALTAIQNSSTANAVNFEDGFPSAYSAPASNNGKYVSRGEINAIGNLASRNEFCRSMGQIITFDPELARIHDGYPKYAVLEYLVGLDYNRVISLVENNKVDFTGATLTAEQIAAGVTSGTVDGINWAFLGNGTIADSTLIASIPNFEWHDTSTSWEAFTFDLFPIGSYTAPRDGVVSFSGSSDTTFSQVGTSSTSHSGFMVLCAPSGDGVFKFKYSVIYNRGNPASVEAQSVTPSAYSANTEIKAYSYLTNSGAIYYSTVNVSASDNTSWNDVSGNMVLVSNSSSISIGYSGTDVCQYKMKRGVTYNLYIYNIGATVESSTLKINLI